MIITSHSPSLFTLHSFTYQHRAICKSPLRQNAKALMLIWDNHFFTLHSLMCQHRAICKSPLRQNAKALILIWDNHFSPHTQAHSLGYTLHSSLFTLHFSLFTPPRAYIGRFANRPYERTQKPSCQYGIITFHHIPKLIRLATLFTFHSSLFTAHSPTLRLLRLKRSRRGRGGLFW